MPRKAPRNLKKQEQVIKIGSHSQFMFDLQRQLYICKVCKKPFALSQLNLDLPVKYGDQILAITDHPELVKFRNNHLHAPRPRHHGNT